jgi:DNA modification methylase
VVKLMMGEVVEMLQRLPDQSVQMAVTSPPYFCVRDYGIEGQIGHEPTVEAYVERLVEVFRELRRVLRDDGTFWLNVGDSFSTTDGSYGRSDPKSQKSNAFKLGQYYRTGKIKSTSGLPAKNLVGVPWRVAFALQADGWGLRQDIIWSKVSCLPEPVKDRPSSTHEHMFLFFKSPRYYYDKKATGELGSFKLLENGTKYQNSVWNLSSGSSGINVCKGCNRLYHPDEYKRLASDGNFGTHDASQRKASQKLLQSEGNPRSAKICSHCGGTEWEAHAAPFPQKLVAPCIMAGTSDKGACVNCGTCWIRDGKGWKKNCECKTNEVRPCIVLDCFSGSGTTGVVALRLGRSYLGIDLSPAYTGAAYERLARVAKVRGLTL